MSNSLDGKVALITGAARGIGHAAALALAAEGAHIIAVARPKSQGALEELDDEITKAGGSGVTLVPMDLTDGAAIDRLGGAIYERWGKLDILIANAGILGPISPLGHVSPQDWDKVIAANLTANFRLIRSMDPLLKMADAGRAIFVTSSVARKHKQYWGPYAVSKSALEQLALTYSAECEISSIKVNLLDPGPMRTGMRALAMPGEDPETLPHPNDAGPLFVELCQPDLTKAGEIFSFYEWANIKRA